MKFLLLVSILSYCLACRKQCNDSFLNSVVQLINRDTLISEKYKSSDVLMKRKLLLNLCSQVKNQEKMVIFEQVGTNGYFHRGIVYFLESNQLFSYMVNEKFEIKFKKGGKYDKDGLLQKILEPIMESGFNLEHLQNEKKRNHSHAAITKLYFIDLKNKTNNKLLFF